MPAADWLRCAGSDDYRRMMMPEAISGLSVFQTIIVLFGAGGFCTAGGVIYSFGKKSQRITDIEEELKEGKGQFLKINDTLVEHGKILAVINDRTKKIAGER